jgi:hypothetical protein
MGVFSVLEGQASPRLNELMMTKRSLSARKKRKAQHTPLFAQNDVLNVVDFLHFVNCPTDRRIYIYDLLF